METTTAAAAVAAALERKMNYRFSDCRTTTAVQQLLLLRFINTRRGIFSATVSTETSFIVSSAGGYLSYRRAELPRSNGILNYRSQRRHCLPVCLPNWLKVKFKCNQKLEPKNRTRTAFPRFNPPPSLKLECSNQKTMTTNLVIRAANDRAENGREMDWQLMMTMMMVLVLLIIICHTHAHTPTTIKYRVRGRKGWNRKGGGGKGGAGN